MSGKSEASDNALIYGVDDIPPPAETAVLGLQHYLTMFGSTVAIPLMMAGPLGIADDAEKLGWLIGTMFFVSGIATLLQTTIGNRLPIVQGGTFSFLAPAIAICSMASLNEAGFEVKMQHIQGAVIVGGVVQMAVGYSGLIGKLLKYVGPVTIEPTIALIGLALYPFGVPTVALDWKIGGLTIFLVVLFSQVLRKKHRIFELFPILLGMGGAWLAAIVLSETGYYSAGDPSFTSWDRVAEAAWFRVPLPFQWGMPVFNAAAIIGMMAGVAASIVESVGDYYACARLAGAPVPTAKVVSRGIGTEGLGGLIAGIFGSGNGTTSYSENIGAIGLTRVGSRRVVQAGALIMIVLGVTSKFGALFTAMPQHALRDDRRCRSLQLAVRGHERLAKPLHYWFRVLHGLELAVLLGRLPRGAPRPIRGRSLGAQGPWRCGHHPREHGHGGGRRHRRGARQHRSRHRRGTRTDKLGTFP